MTKPLRVSKGGALPEEFDVAHDLCMVLHDLMAQIVVNGIEKEYFVKSLDLTAEELEELDSSEDVFEWLDKSNRVDDRSDILMTTVFPAVLGDMLHCIFEALECSRKGKLNISYMLIRKPLQESLYLLEQIVADQNGFADKLATDPLKLRSQNAGGVEGHSKRIKKVLEVIGESDRFDPDYIAMLRYDKKSNDSFDGICNHAMHLFTEHKAIKTEKLNINFIFSDWYSMTTQWAYLYSRMPYLIEYIYRIVEYLMSKFASTDPSFLNYVDRRIAALVARANLCIDDEYRSDELEDHANITFNELLKDCLENGYREPTEEDLIRMSIDSSYPGEFFVNRYLRDLRFKCISAKNRLLEYLFR